MVVIVHGQNGFSTSRWSECRRETVWTLPHLL